MVAYVRGIGTGVVASLADDGAPQAASLDLTATDRGELVFNTRTDSRTLANLLRDSRVAIVIGGADGTTHHRARGRGRDLPPAAPGSPHPATL